MNNPGLDEAAMNVTRTTIFYYSTRMRWIAALPCVIVMVVRSGAASGNEVSTYPSEPICPVLLFAAGGVSDVIFRVLANEMSNSLG
ncbi:MAG: hypothetical protein QHC78_16945 [Pigmentiphaga sp.]|uniref:hypothetical protein n=1 Tax=Pigmentiphaga sp. TaxID=1977564 RepID=UPI0029BCB966|nr:hypothetical protein [Pigmentiphaga sp.]MDX3907379.1 hypothetical protein [Pigmentiphaga sp.]